jgi:hypothetical protein
MIPVFPLCVYRRYRREMIFFVSLHSSAIGIYRAHIPHSAPLIYTVRINSRHQSPNWDWEEATFFSICGALTFTYNRLTHKILYEWEWVEELYLLFFTSGNKFSRLATHKTDKMAKNGQSNFFIQATGGGEINPITQYNCLVILSFTTKRLCHVKFYRDLNRLSFINSKVLCDLFSKCVWFSYHSNNPTVLSSGKERKLLKSAQFYLTRKVYRFS